MHERWRQLDSRLFTVDIPPGWATDEHAGGLVALRDPTQSVVISLRAISHAPTPIALGLHLATPEMRTRPNPPPLITARDAQQQLRRWITQHRQVKLRHGPRLIAAARHLLCTASGTERLTAGVPWYKRLLGQGPWLQWRFWAALNPHMLVLASCQGEPEAVALHRANIDRVVDSLVLPQRDLLVGRHFSEAVATLARRYYPHLNVAQIDEGHMRFGACHVDLLTLHKRYLDAPELLREQVRTFLSDVQRLNDSAEQAVVYERVRSSIMPVLVPTSDLARYGLHCAHEEWVNDLHIVYVVDDSGAYRAVHNDDCELWGITLDTLHEQAIVNLHERSTELVMEGARAEGYTKLALAQPDPYNASRILLPDLHRKLRQHLGHVFYVGIPARDVLMVFNTRRADVLERLRKQVASDYRRMDDPVSPRLFQITPDGIAGDPAGTGGYAL
jgi:uncharacterized protein YtpQ (UPF0354 family)